MQKKKDECKYHLAHLAKIEFQEANACTLNEITIKIALLFHKKNKVYEDIPYVDILSDEYPYDIHDVIKMAHFISTSS